MTVGELTEVLKSYDSDLEVRLNYYTELNIDDVYKTSVEYITVPEKPTVTIDVNLDW